MHHYLQFSRPYTLIVPALGIISGAIAALGATPPLEMNNPFLVAIKVVLCGIIAALLNAASNALNQIYDLPIDRHNKPERPLVTGKISLREAWYFVIFFYCATVGLSFFLSFYFALMVVIAALCTIIYSVPPLRTKRHWLAATLTIAIPRGVLLKVAGWAVLRKPDSLEPWFLGGIFGIFLLGAVTTKDYADIEGDKQGDCVTLPIRFGIIPSAWMIAPFFIVPFVFFPLGAYWQILTGHLGAIIFLGVSLMVWGAYVVWLILRDPHALAGSENHPSWRHMYLMMIYSQIGLAAAYLY